MSGKKNNFWTIKGLFEVLNYGNREVFMHPICLHIFSTLYTTLPHNLIKEKIVDLIERVFQREGSLQIECNGMRAFFSSKAVRNITYGLVRKYVKLLPFSQATVMLDFALNYIGKFQVFHSILFVLLLQLVRFSFVMREISLCLLQKILKLMLLKRQ